MADIFISYSRLDSAFVHRLSDAFTASGHETWVDWQDIPPSAKFLEEIYAGIEEASAFVFVLSPASISSKVCLTEIEHAVQYKKKLLPVVCDTVDPNLVPPHLREMNWIRFDVTNFDTAFQELLFALETDLNSWRQAAQWLKRARLWENKKHDSSILLRGKELKEAGRWLVEGTRKLPYPTSLHAQFIRMSRRNARIRATLNGILICLLLLAMTGVGLALWQYINTPNPSLVTTLNDHGPGSLRQAIDTAKAGSTITFRTGLHGTILLTSADLAFDKNLTIRGPATGTITISGGLTGYEVHVLKGISVSIFRLSFENNNVDCLAINASTSSKCASVILNEGTLTLTDSIISHNIVSSGEDGAGSIYNEEGTLTLISSIISDNMIDGINGAGLVSLSGTVTIINSTISHNTCTCATGGGIGDIGSTILLTNSTVSDNKIDGGSGGGLAFTLSNVTLTNSTISNNIATENGGGIYDEGSTISLINSTISGNTATSGGGLFIIPQFSPLFALAQADLTFCTIYANRAPTGSDIMIQSQSKVTIQKSLVVADNAHYRPDITGTLTSDGYNIFQDNVGAIFHPRTSQHLFDQTISMKNLASLFALPVELRINDGSTQTYALSPASPAIDQIPLAACHLKGITTDQRGSQRPDGNELFCDIGAYEFTV